MRLPTQQELSSDSISKSFTIPAWVWWMTSVVITLVAVCFLLFNLSPGLTTEQINHVHDTWKRFESKIDLPQTENSEPNPLTQDSDSLSASSIDSNEEKAHTDISFLEEAKIRAQTDPAGTMEWLQSQVDQKGRLEAMLAVVAIWAAEDANNTLLWLENNAEGITRIETLNSGVAFWTKQDPLAAASWVEGMAEDGSKVVAAQAIVQTWAKTDPTATSTWINTLPNGVVKDEAAHSLVETWAKSDPNEASYWALEQAVLSGNQTFLDTAIKQYALATPDKAADFLRKLDGALPTEQAIQTYFETRGENSPQSTGNWLQNLPKVDPLNQPNNYATLAETWTLTDSVAVSSWLANLEPSLNRDAAIQGFTETILNFNPAAAASWSTEISDPEIKTQWVEFTLLNWAEKSPAEALSWLQNSGLESHTIETIASQIGAH